MELPNEQQLFYSKDGSTWQPSLDGTQWPEEKCAGYLHKHLSWDEFQEMVNPPKTPSQLFSEEFKALKKEYDEDVQALNIAFASAFMVDGDTEAEKHASIRAQYNTRKAEYQSAIVDLRTKYYG